MGVSRPVSTHLHADPETRRVLSERLEQRMIMAEQRHKLVVAFRFALGLAFRLEAST